MIEKNEFKIEVTRDSGNIKISTRSSKSKSSVFTPPFNDSAQKTLPYTSYETKIPHNRNSSERTEQLLQINQKSNMESMTKSQLSSLLTDKVVPNHRQDRINKLVANNKIDNSSRISSSNTGSSNFKNNSFSDHNESKIISSFNTNSSKTNNNSQFNFVAMKSKKSKVEDDIENSDEEYDRIAEELLQSKKLKTENSDHKMRSFHTDLATSLSDIKLTETPATTVEKDEISPIIRKKKTLTILDEDEDIFENALKDKERIKEEVQIHRKKANHIKEEEVVNKVEPEEGKYEEEKLERINSRMSGMSDLCMSTRRNKNRLKLEHSNSKENSIRSPQKSPNAVDSNFQTPMSQHDSEDEKMDDRKRRRLKKLIEDKRENQKGSVSKNIQNGEQESNEKTCAICLSDITEDLAKLDSCLHIFCFTCIKDWADVTNECPLCKRRFSEINKYDTNGEKIDTTKVEFKQQVYEYDGEGLEDDVSEADDVCYICEANDNPGLLLICDSCSFYCCHTYCMNPPLAEVPVDDWLCDFCTNSTRVRNHRRRQTNENTGNANRRPGGRRARSQANPRPQSEPRNRTRTTRRRNQNEPVVRPNNLQPGSLLSRLWHVAAETDNNFGSLFNENSRDSHSRGSNSRGSNSSRGNESRGSNSNNAIQRTRSTRNNENSEDSNRNRNGNRNNDMSLESFRFSRRRDVNASHTLEPERPRRVNERRAQNLDALNSLIVRRVTRSINNH